MGRANYNNGYYEGSFREGTSIKEGHGTYYWKGGDKYVGNWSNDVKSGYGTYYYAASGDKYVGNWEYDNKSGRGTYYYASSGDKYVGNWKYNQRSGNGTYYYKEGGKYVGEWKNDNRTGKGTYYDIDGAKIVGEWLNSKKHGYCVIYYPAGVVAKANFYNDKLHGEYQLYFKDFLICEEKYNMGERDGTAINYGYNNTYEKFTYVNGVKQGKYEFYTRNKISFIGNYKDGKTDGICFRYDYFNGEITEEKWKNGDFVKTVSVTPMKNFASKKKLVTINYPDGRKYVGEVRNNKPHGIGTLYFSNHEEEKPNYYSGNFYKGKYRGEGKLVECYGNGKIYSYEGEFKNDFKHGYGIKRYGEDSYVCGTFKLDDISGICYLYHFIGNIECALATMKNGSPRGRVYFQYTNGDYYYGKTKDFSKHGKGCYHYKNGGFVNGKFKNDKIHGKAIYVSADNTVYECVYKNGALISQVKAK